MRTSSFTFARQLRAHPGALVAAALVALAGACTFRPDYSRYPPCGDDDTCPAGSLCWPEERLCLPLCGEQSDPEACLDAGTDAGAEPQFDAGTDAGTEDAGMQDGGSEELDAGVDAGEPLEFPSITLPTAIELEAYPPPDGGDVQFTATGGMPPYVFDVADGALPDGLQLTEDGALTGTPGDAGTSAFTVRVTDAASAARTQDLSLEVVPLLRIASNDPLPSADSGDAYLEQLQTTGGSGQPLVWSYVSGAFPTNVMMTSGGLLTTGSNKISGSGNTFTVSVTDPGPPVQVQTRTFTITVNLNPLGLGFHILTNTLPDGRLGTPYSYRLKSGGGTGNPSWTLTSAAPPGLALVGDTLQGTPTQRGSFSVSIQAKASATANKTFTLQVW